MCCMLCWPVVWFRIVSIYLLSDTYLDGCLLGSLFALILHSYIGYPIHIRFLSLLWAFSSILLRAIINNPINFLAVGKFDNLVYMTQTYMFSNSRNMWILYCVFWSYVDQMHQIIICLLLNSSLWTYFFVLFFA